MTSKLRYAPAGVLAVVALGAPTAATAHIDVAVSSVKAHTDRADAGLARAIEQFDERARARAARSFEASRKEMGLAKAEAAKLRRQADNRSERGEAARGHRAFGEQANENVPELATLLRPARGEVENAVAQAALSDTRGRDKAVAVISALLLQGVPSQAEQGLTRALAALAQDRGDDVQAEARALVSGRVAGESKADVVRALEAGVDGQARAAAKIAELLADEDMPEQSKFGLQTAYDAVIGEQEGAADTLEGFSDRMPANVRSFVEQIVAQARENAQELRENRPTPPRGYEGTPGEGFVP